MPSSDPKRELLRHTLATLAYRGGKAVRNAPVEFADFHAGEGVRTPGQILAHMGEATRPPRFAPARGPPLWQAAAAVAASNDPAWDHTAPPAPDLEFDQRITW